MFQWQFCSSRDSLPVWKNHGRNRIFPICAGRRTVAERCMSQIARVRSCRATRQSNFRLEAFRGLSFGCIRYLMQNRRLCSALLRIKGLNHGDLPTHQEASFCPFCLMPAQSRNANLLSKTNSMSVSFFVLQVSRGKSALDERRNSFPFNQRSSS